MRSGLAYVYSRLFGPAEVKAPVPIPRFEAEPEFKSIVMKMKELAVIVDNFQKEAGQDPVSLAYRKHAIFSAIQKELLAHIEKFNREQPNLEKTNENIKEKIRFVLALANGIKRILDVCNPTLNEHRKPARVAMAKGAVKAASYVVVGTAAVATTFSGLLAAAAMYFAGGRVSDSAEEIAGVKEILPASLVFIRDFHSMLHAMAKTLSLKINLDEARRNPKTGVPPAFLCGITGEIMKDSVLFLLDGISYERAALQRALAKRKVSPVYGMEMPDEMIKLGEEHYLLPNRNLQDAIHGYLLEHPEMADEESQMQIPDTTPVDLDVAKALDSDERKTPKHRVS